MGLRDIYNRFEKVAAPLAAEVTRTEEFAQAAALFTAVNKTVRAEAQKVQARVWHAVNLPAGSDLQRMKVQLGSLDREVRLLTLELQKSRKEAARRGTSRPEHD